MRIENISELDSSIFIVPGFANTKSWLNSMNQNQLRELVYQYHNKKYSSLSGAVGNWWQSEKMTTEKLLS
jgi:hypothetical protein